MKILRKAKKLLALMLAMIMLLSLAACGGAGNQGQQGGTNQSTGASVKLKIVAADFGYGTNWLKAIAQVYMSQNRNVSIQIEGTPIPHQLLSQIQGGLDAYDIFLGTSPLGGLGEDGYFVCIDDVVNATCEGEEKTVLEKLGTLAEGMVYYDHYYSLPYVNSPTGMVVNHDTMKALYGDNYKLPNTTDEFLAMGKDIAGKGAYPYMDSISYTDMLMEVWWNQYDAVGYQNYWKGVYIDENGQEQKALNGESLDQPGKLEAYKLAQTLLNPKYGYNHQYATTMDFAEAQLAFLGQGYGGIDNKLIAFMPNGAWLENEMEMVLAEYPADFEMFRVPVISSIINVLPDKSVADDAELSALITAIDAGSTALSGTGYEVTQKDFDRVKEARFYVGQNSTAHEIGIVSTCKNVDVAKDFLLFMTSNQASSVAGRELAGVALPFGYLPSSADGYEISNYVQSANRLCEGATFICHGSSVLTDNGLAISKLVGQSLCAALRTGEKTAEQIYQDDIAGFTNAWKYMLGQ